MEYLKWFLNDSLLNSVVTETNRYSNQFVNNNWHYLNVHPHSAVHTWIKEGHTTKEEILAFIGLVLNMGLIRNYSINLYWDTSSECLPTPFFVEHFARHRFLLVLKFLHFAENETKPAEDSP